MFAFVGSVELTRGLGPVCSFRSCVRQAGILDYFGSGILIGWGSPGEILQRVCLKLGSQFLFGEFVRPFQFRSQEILGPSPAGTAPSAHNMDTPCQPRGKFSMSQQVS